VSGWVLDHVADLDAHSPGFAGIFLRASSERRQVVSAFLAAKSHSLEVRRDRSLAQYLSLAGHTELLRSAFGAVPRGLRGALRRSGPQPHPRGYYLRLFQVFSCREHRRLASVVGQLPQLDMLRLRIAQQLPEVIRKPKLVMMVDTIPMASDVREMVRLLQVNGMDIESLAGAIDTLPDAARLPALWHRWCEKVPFSSTPIGVSDRYKPVQTGAELRQLAQKYRNCARRFLGQALDGHSAFAEFLGPEGGAVVHLEKFSDAWSLEGLYGRDNMLVSGELQAAAVRYLSERGIRTSERREALDGEWAVLRRLSRSHLTAF
jgi:hypothetical protein